MKFAESLLNSRHLNNLYTVMAAAPPSGMILLLIPLVLKPLRSAYNRDEVQSPAMAYIHGNVFSGLIKCKLQVFCYLYFIVLDENSLCREG